jgi:hypothetical protein
LWVLRIDADPPSLALSRVVRARFSGALLLAFIYTTASFRFPRGADPRTSWRNAPECCQTAGPGRMAHRT